MTTVVTGATGAFGRAVVESLLAKGIPGSEIIGAGRRVERLDGLGITGKYVTYDDPLSLRELFSDADKVLFVSGTEMEKRVQQHQNVIDAATAAQVRLVVYTSAAKADTTDISWLPTTESRNGCWHSRGCRM
jgi:NAD(P)H dehydrogenase (quinone)